MEYTKAVAEGRALLARGETAQWDLARLTYRVLVEEKTATIQQWADDLGVSAAHAHNLRNVWAKYGEHYRGNGRTKGTFNELYTLARSSAERAARLQRQAEEEGVSVTTVDRRGTRVQRLRDVRAQLRDEGFARDVMRDPKVLANIDRIRGRAKEEEGRPRRLGGRQLQHQLIGELTSFQRRLGELLGQLIHRKLPAGAGKSIIRAVKPVDNSLEWLVSFAESGDTSFEQALEDVLSDEAEDRPAPPRKEPKDRAPEREPAADADPEPVRKPRREPPVRDGGGGEGSGNGGRRRKPRRIA